MSGKKSQGDLQLSFKALGGLLVALGEIAQGGAFAGHLIGQPDQRAVSGQALQSSPIELFPGDGIAKRRQGVAAVGVGVSAGRFADA